MENRTTADQLRHQGWRPLEVIWSTTGHDHPTYGPTRDFDLAGEVPESPGLYLFTVDGVGPGELAVLYVGLSTHLWMVTHGRLPAGGGARGGQRYGRPKHSGLTRQRINAQLLAHHLAGERVRQWVRAHRDPAIPLPAVEEAEILRYATRVHGYNRG